MFKLDQDYKERLQAVAEVIQGSNELAAYLDEESPELFKTLSDTYEPLLAELHQEIAENHPLQILEMENVVTNTFFEGLFLPRILGYSVMRGELNDQFKYARPQEHFKDILIAICQSSNFDNLKQRIGQTVQVGFALSSDIWITNLLDKVENKKVKAFLQSMKQDRFRDIEERKKLVDRYKKQFSHYNFYTTIFPSTIGELKVESDTLKTFLLNRIRFDSKHDSYHDALMELIKRKDFYNEVEYIELLVIISNFIELDTDDHKVVADALNTCRTNNPQFNGLYLQYIKQCMKDGLTIGGVENGRVSNLLDKSITDELTKYYNLLDMIHSKGFINDDVIESVNGFYSQFEGMSTINECLRLSILQHISGVMNNLTEEEYPSYIELNKVFATYINIFENQAFNQEVKSVSMNFVRKCLTHFIDKRGKEYQEIKKFIFHSFPEMEFMTEKELVDLFKTKRKKKEEE